jgi:hypothetical protein
MTLWHIIKELALKDSEKHRFCSHLQVTKVGTLIDEIGPRKTIQKTKT